MKLTLESLYRDHDNLRKILCLLERLLIDIYRGSFENYSMLQRILRYVQDYPAKIHHPAEYAVFSAVSKQESGHRKFHEDVNSLMKDHAEIDDIIRAAIAATGPVPVGTDTDMTDITDRLSLLIKRERSHLLCEEINIYPYVAAHLDSKDWNKISALVPDHEDPLFGDTVRKEYQSVFNAL